MRRELGTTIGNRRQELRATPNNLAGSRGRAGRRPGKWEHGAATTCRAVRGVRARAEVVLGLCFSFFSARRFRRAAKTRENAPEKKGGVDRKWGGVRPARPRAACQYISWRLHFQPLGAERVCSAYQVGGPIDLIFRFPLRLKGRAATGLGRGGKRAGACRPARSFPPSRAAAAAWRLGTRGLSDDAASEGHQPHAISSCCAQPLACAEHAAAVHSSGRSTRVDCRRWRSPPIAMGSRSLRGTMAGSGRTRPPPQLPVPPAAPNGTPSAAPVNLRQS